MGRYYPERWLQFMVETMRGGRYSWVGIGVHGRMPRLVEYLLSLGRGSEALALTQGVREVIEGLVSPFGMDQEDWLNVASTSGEMMLDILLTRLTWPSGMVRERACNSLAALLATEQLQKPVADALVGWIEDQRLESLACLGLLPFIRARQQDPAVPIPSRDALRNACVRPSLAYVILLGELSGQRARALPPGVGHGGSAPKDFRASDEFSEQHDHALPTCYKERAELFGRRFAVPFMRQWGFEVAQTGQDLRNAHLPLESFWGRRDGEHFVAFDCRLSETLRSGFLRALAWLAEQGEEQRFWAATEAVRTLPIDLGLWCVKPQPIPEWWPLQEAPKAEELDTAPPTILSAVEELWARQNSEEWILCMAAGRIAEGGAVYDLDIFGVFQKCQGSQHPEADDFFEAEPWWRDTIHLAPISPQMAGKADAIPLEQTTVALADWEILPCVLHGHSYVAARWQWWRLIRELWLPLPNLAGPNGYNVECGENGIGITTIPPKPTSSAPGDDT